MKTWHRRLSFFAFDAVATSNDVAAAWRNISPKVVQLDDTLLQHPENPIFLNFLEGASIWGNYKGRDVWTVQSSWKGVPVRNTVMQNIHLPEVKNSNPTLTNTTRENWDLDEIYLSLTEQCF